MEYHISLASGRYYHIYNRGIAGENIFLEERNYAYFLNLYTKHVGPVAETFAYCLLRNHFHLFIRIRGFRGPSPARTGTAARVLDPSQSFSNFFNAYAKAINKTYGRTGSLFEHRFHRLEVTSERHCLRLIHYIHFNPQKHGFVADFREYSFSSYRAMLSDGPTQLQRAQVLDWFGGEAGFDAVHRALDEEREIWHLVSEDE